MRFTKMHGLGNDFVVIDGVTAQPGLTRESIRWLADRRYGVGCDQILVVEASDRDDADFRYRIYNADGGEVEHCGNGVRCLARFVQRLGLAGPGALCFATSHGLTRVVTRADDLVTVDMGPPILEPRRIPFRAAEHTPTHQIAVGDDRLTISAVSMGNPHAVLQVADTETAAVREIGPAVETHPDFPNGANVGFMAIIDDSHIRLRVHERGAGETLACGTGACAAVVAGHLRGLLASDVTVELPGGELMIHWRGGDAPVQMTGPAVAVFDGETLPPNE